MSTALQKALAGQTVPEGSLKGGFAQAVDKIRSMSNGAEKMKEKITGSAELVIGTLETQGAVVLASTAEGYFGEKMSPGGYLDLRAPTAVLFLGYAAYDALAGKGGAAPHVAAIGNGILASYAASNAVKLGQAIKQKMSEPAAPSTTVSGPQRSIHMTSAELEDERGSRRPNRFRPARAREYARD